MASAGIPIPKDATIGEPAPQRGAFTAASGVNYIPDDAQVQNEGEIVNDVGNKVIVPKEGESFADTMKRAVQYHESLTPEQRKSAIGKELATAPKKAAQALGGAAVAGVAGPAALAGAGEAGAVLPSIVPHTIEGVKAIGAWAAKNPVQAYILYQVIKELVPGAKKAMGIIKDAPE